MTLVTQKFAGVVNGQIDAPANYQLTVFDAKQPVEDLVVLDHKEGFARILTGVKLLGRKVSTGGAKAIGYIEIVDNDDLDGVDVFVGSNQYQEGYNFNKGANANETAENLAEVIKNNDWGLDVEVNGVEIKLTVKNAGEQGNYTVLTSSKAGVDVIAFAGGVDPVGTNGGNWKFTLDGSYQDLGFGGIMPDFSRHTAVMLDKYEAFGAVELNQVLMNGLLSSVVEGRPLMVKNDGMVADLEYADFAVLVEFTEIKL